MPRTKYLDNRGLARAQITARNTYCERCGDYFSLLVQILEPSTLSAPLPFWVCVDTLACKTRKQAQRAESQPAFTRKRAQGSDLYPD